MPFLSFPPGPELKLGLLLASGRAAVQHIIRRWRQKLRDGSPSLWPSLQSSLGAALSPHIRSQLGSRLPWQQRWWAWGPALCRLWGTQTHSGEVERTSETLPGVLPWTPPALPALPGNHFINRAARVPSERKVFLRRATSSVNKEARKPLRAAPWPPCPSCVKYEIRVLITKLGSQPTRLIFNVSNACAPGVLALTESGFPLGWLSTCLEKRQAATFPSTWEALRVRPGSGLALGFPLPEGLLPRWPGGLLPTLGRTLGPGGPSYGAGLSPRFWQTMGVSEVRPPRKIETNSQTDLSLNSSLMQVAQHLWESLLLFVKWKCISFVRDSDY